MSLGTKYIGQLNIFVKSYKGATNNLVFMQNMGASKKDPTNTTQRGGGKGEI